LIKKYELKYKNTTFIGLIYSIFTMLICTVINSSDDVDSIKYITFYTIFAIISLITNRNFFINDWETGEEELNTSKLVKIYNAVIMFVSLLYMLALGHKDSNWTFLVILISVLLFSNNTMKLLEINENFSIYLAIKFTILMIVVLKAFDAMSIIISITCFIIAAVSITLGFIVLIKGFRIYGLVLSLLSACKLILIDIGYNSSMSRAVGFLICGIICFGISFVYNKMEHLIE
jgi:hypothetical protein